jgi:hypothetical protein
MDLHGVFDQLFQGSLGLWVAAAIVLLLIISFCVVYWDVVVNFYMLIYYLCAAKHDVRAIGRDYF